MAEEQHLSIEYRRKKLLKLGWKEFLPSILIGHFQLEEIKLLAHVCDEVGEKYNYGGYFTEGKCEECGFVPSENIQFMMKLLEFKV